MEVYPINSAKIIIDQVERYLMSLSKTRAIQIQTEKKLHNYIKSFRQSSGVSAADTGKEAQRTSG